MNTPTELATQGGALTSPEHKLLVSPLSAFKRCIEAASSDEPVELRLHVTALLNCVVACGDPLTSEDAVMKMRQLLAQLDEQELTADVLNFAPEPIDEKKMSGTPLFLAAKLDLDEAADVLLLHGASVVHKWKGVTPLQVAIEKKSEAVLRLFEEYIAQLEQGPVANLNANFRGAAAELEAEETEDSPRPAGKRTRTGASESSATKKRRN